MVKQGSIIMVDFNPVIGSEQGGRRPGVVISSNLAISKTNITYVCPITSKQAKTAMNVLLDERTSTSGVVLCAHGKAFDLGVRPYSVVEELPKDKFTEVLNTVMAIING
jgi:mRNA interferase MazF